MCYCYCLGTHLNYSTSRILLDFQCVKAVRTVNKKDSHYLPFLVCASIWNFTYMLLFGWSLCACIQAPLPKEAMTEGLCKCASSSLYSPTFKVRVSGNSSSTLRFDLMIAIGPLFPPSLTPFPSPPFPLLVQLLTLSEPLPFHMDGIRERRRSQHFRHFPCSWAVPEMLAYPVWISITHL